MSTSNTHSLAPHSVVVKPDPEQVRQDLAAVLADGQPHEITAIGPGGAVWSVVVDDVETAVAAVLELDEHEPSGIYVTHNAVSRAPGGRRRGRCNTNDVETLSHLFVDIDPVADWESLDDPSRERERARLLRIARDAALTVQDMIEAHAGGTVFPAWQGVSGNGRYLIYRIDPLPATPENRAMLADAVQALGERVAARHPEVAVDRHGGDAVRLRRIGGTVNRKYTPHVLAEITSHPEPTTLDHDTLIALAGHAERAARDAAPPAGPREIGTRVMPDTVRAEIVAAFRKGRRLGNRHDTALSVAGWLLWRGYSVTDARSVYDAVTGDDTDLADRAAIFDRTVERFAAGEPVQYHAHLTPSILAEVDRLHAIGMVHGQQQRTPTGDVEAAFPRTDAQNAEWLVDRYGDVIRYADDTGEWYAFDGAYWRPGDKGTIKQLALAAIRAIHVEVVGRGLDPKEIDDIRKHATASESERKLNAMINIAASAPSVRTTSTAFDTIDSIAHLIPFADGTVVDTETGEVRHTTREDMITRSLPVVYDPTATAPTWGAFVDWITNGDREYAAYLQRMAGYSLLGHNHAQLAFFVCGTGRNGKSVFLSILGSVFGDYAYAAPPSLFQEQRFEQHPEALAQMAGRRLVTTSEPASEGRLNEAVLKRITGGDEISARHLRQDRFTFVPIATPWLLMNRRPELTDGGDSIFDRLRVLPFTRQITPEERDPNLAKHIRAEELPGVAQWLLDGLRDYLANGEGIPEIVRAATDEYRETSDPVTGWMRARTVDIGDQIGDGTRTLYQDWKRFMEDAGETTEGIGERRFRELLATNGYHVDKINGKRGVRGLALVENAGASDGQLTTEERDGMTVFRRKR